MRCMFAIFSSEITYNLWNSFMRATIGCALLHASRRLLSDSLPGMRLFVFDFGAYCAEVVVRAQGKGGTAKGCGDGIRQRLPQRRNAKAFLAVWALAMQCAVLTYGWCYQGPALTKTLMPIQALLKRDEVGPSRQRGTFTLFMGCGTLGWSCGCEVKQYGRIGKRQVSAGEGGHTYLCPACLNPTPPTTPT